VVLFDTCLYGCGPLFVLGGDGSGLPVPGLRIHHGRTSPAPKRGRGAVDSARGGRQAQGWRVGLPCWRHPPRGHRGGQAGYPSGSPNAASAWVSFAENWSWAGNPHGICPSCAVHQAFGPAGRGRWTLWTTAPHLDVSAPRTPPRRQRANRRQDAGAGTHNDESRSVPRQRTAVTSSNTATPLPHRAVHPRMCAVHLPNFRRPTGHAQRRTRHAQRTQDADDLPAARACERTAQVVVELFSNTPRRGTRAVIPAPRDDALILVHLLTGRDPAI